MLTIIIASIQYARVKICKSAGEDSVSSLPMRA